MVESTKSREQIYQELLDMARTQFTKAEEVPIIKQIEKDQITVRQASNGQEVVNVAEAKHIEGLKPEDFKVFFERWSEASVEINPECKSCPEVDEEEGFKVYKMEVNMPWPLWNR